MSQTNDHVEDVKEKLEVVDDTEKVQSVEDGHKDQICGEETTTVAGAEEVKDSDENEKNPMPSAEDEVK